MAWCNPSYTLCAHEATDVMPDITHPSSGALSVDKDCPPSTQPKHGQIRALGTSVPRLSVPKKEKSENDLKKKKGSTFGHLVLVSLKEKFS